MTKLIFVARATWAGFGHAQNFVNNGSFDSGIEGWSQENFTLTWISDDGASSNGALEVSDNFNNGGVATVANETLIDVTPGETYTLSGALKVMPNTEAQGAALLVQWLDENQFHVGFTDFVNSDPDVTDGTWHTVSGDFTAPDDMVFARIFVGVTTNDNGSTDFAVARFDDVRFVLTGATTFAVVAAHTGSWLNPEQGGHGLNIEILDNNQALIFWYVYTDQTNPIRIFGSGNYSGSTITVDASTASGPMFPPNYNARDAHFAPLWQFEVTFTGCNTLTFRWTPLASNGFTAGEMDMTRLTQIKGMTCSE